MSVIRIGSRKSKLAVKQSDITIDLIKHHHPQVMFEFTPIVTAGDIDMSIPKNDESLKNKFVKEIEVSLLANQIDLAIHSLKDLPVKQPDGLIIPFFPEREDPRDCLISSIPFDQLPYGAKIGTSSLRRMRQIKNLRNDLDVIPIRGNINTRIQKVKDGEFDGIVIAYAGVKRLHLEHEVATIFSLKEIVPAPGQGMLGLQIRENDHMMYDLLKPLHKSNQAQAVAFEIELNRRYGGGCHTPFGAFVEVAQKTATIYFYCFEVNETTNKEHEIILNKTYPLHSFLDDLKQDIDCIRKEQQ
ncbi:MAG: hydroxymethylbilane synthase [Culicoidibacterales bacterium]